MPAASSLSNGNVLQMDVSQIGHANSLRFFFNKTTQTENVVTEKCDVAEN